MVENMGQARCNLAKVSCTVPENAHNEHMDEGPPTTRWSAQATVPVGWCVQGLTEGDAHRVQGHLGR